MRPRAKRLRLGVVLVIFMAWGSFCRGQGLGGGIRGAVYDAEFDGPVPDATVTILELDRQQATGEDGNFLLGNVPAGVYTLTITKPGYGRETLAAVLVREGSLTEASVQLKGEFTEMEELVVRDLELTDTASETGLLNLRSTSLSFQDSISKDLMSRAGASDAASALRLVVGASVADGKYATVRGLSDRYVGTALNGLRVPSSDPRKRAVQLDVFPAGTIESLTVSKTFTPDLPGDYTGGGVNIRTIGIPDKPFLKVSSSRDFNRTYTGKPGFVTYEGAKVGPWGRDLGARDLPVVAADMDENGLNNRGLSSEHSQLADDEHPHDDEHQQYDAIVRSMAPAMGTKQIDMPDGNYGVTVSGGDRYDYGGGTVAGMTAAFTYSQKYSRQDAAETALTIPDTNNPQNLVEEDFNRNTGTAEVKWSMLGTVGLAHDDDRADTLTFLRNRAATDRASLRTEPLTSAGLEQQQAISYTERSLDVMQWTGSRKWDNWLGDFAGLEVDWFGAHNIAEQYEPDVRSFKNYVVPDESNPGQYIFQQQPQGGSGAPDDQTLRLWRDTKEDNSQYGLNLAFPFKRTVPDGVMSFFDAGPQQQPWAQADGKFKMGFVRDWTSRTYEQDSFFYNFGPQRQPTDPSDTAAANAYQTDQSYRTYTNTNPNALWTDVFTDPERLGSGDYQNSMRWYLLSNVEDVDYDGDQNYRSGYWMIELPLTTRLRLSCGARLEGTQITVDPEADPLADPLRPYVVPVKNFIGGNTNNYFYTLDSVSEEEANASIDESDWLRSVGFIYDMDANMKVRGTWSQTIARPTFLELAPVITYDFVSGDNYVGNSDLALSHIVNTDLRWEYFPKPGEVVAASIFHKEIENPIERESFTYLGQDYLLSVNYPEGTVNGWELEARKSLDFLPDLFQYLSVGANYTRIEATVEVPSQQKENLDLYGLDGVTLGQDERDMEGQPEFLWNVNTSIDITPWGTAAGLFYSVRGDMLKSGASIGENGATPNIYAKELATVNFSFSQAFAARWKFTFLAKNLIDPPVDEVYRSPDGVEVLRRRYQEGVSYAFQLGAGW